jgi:predicted secreted protein
VKLDFCPDFELLKLRRRRNTLERGQELGRTRRAVDTSMR